MPYAGLFFAELRDETLRNLMSGASVDLIGQRGSGRSSIVRAVAAALVEHGWDTVRVRAVALLKNRPLEALAIADLARPPERRDESAVSAAVKRIEQAVSDGHTVLIVDDVDDLDGASAGAIIAAHASGPFPILTTSRPRPERLHDAAVRPSEVQPGVQLQVPSLGYVDVHELLSNVLGGRVNPDVVARVNAATGGLPGLVVAMAQAARRSGRVRLQDGVWTASSELWSPSLNRVVWPLVTDLDPAGVEALHLLSLAGAIPVPAAVELIGWDALEDLDACNLLRFVADGDLVVVGVYPLLVEQRYRCLPLGASRLRFHDRVQGLGDAAAQESALPVGTDRPVHPDPGYEPELPGWFDPTPPLTRDDHVDTAVDRLMRDKWHRQYVARKLDWERSPSPRTAMPYLRSLAIGNADYALMSDVIARTPPSGGDREMAYFHQWHARVLAHVAGDPDAARAMLLRVAPQVGRWAGLLRTFEGHLSLVFDRVPCLDPPPEADPEDRTRQFAEALRCEALIAAARPADALALLADARWTDPDLVTVHHVLVGLARFVDGDVRGALAWSGQHFERARAELDPDAIPGHAYAAVSALLVLGRVREVRELLGIAVSSGLSSALQPQFVAGLIDTAAVVAHGEGLTAAADTLSALTATTTASSCFVTASDAPSPSADHGHTGQGDADVIWASALDLLDRGFIASAVFQAGVALDIAPDPRRVATIRSAVGPDACGLVEATLRVAEASVADDPMVAARLAPELIGAGMAALGIRAVGAAVRRLRANGRSAEATDLLCDARRWLERAGADPDGLLSGFAPEVSLTPRELEVGRLVAEGLANPDIARVLGLTVKTVENHLNRVLRKLSVCHRDDVAGALGL